MTRTAHRAAVAALAALAAVAAIIAADFTPPASAQSEESAGRIVARLLEDGRVEFGWQPAGGWPRVLPTQRYFPAEATVDRWLRSSPVEVDGAAIGRINARLLSDGRIEFAFTPTDGERILTDARYFPTSARPNRWLRSTEITIGAPSPFIAVSAGGDTTCGVRENGALECWGFTSGEPIDTPEGNYTAASAGRRHTCAIRDTGEIACWGDYPRYVYLPHERAAPEGSFIAVSVGDLHTCAIAETFTGTNTAANTGEIECWGARAKRAQLYDAPGSIVAWPGRYRAISAAQVGTCAIRDTGELQCWGGATGGQRGGEYRDNSNNIVSVPGPPEGGFTAVSARRGYTCGLRESGAIACWGDGGYENNTSLMNYQAPEGSYSAISAGGGEACAIRASSGEITCWGWQGERTNTPTGSFSAVAAGDAHTCAIRKSDGEIECWGTTAASWQH